MSSVTATQKDTLQVALDRATPGQTDDALQKVKLGTILTPLIRRFTGLVSGTVHDLTLIDATGETAGVANPKRLAALSVTSLRDATGNMIVTDSSGSAVAFTGANGVAILSDDGKSITFPTAQTAFDVVYVPRSGTDMADDFAPSS